MLLARKIFFFLLWTIVFWVGFLGIGGIVVSIIADHEAAKIGPVVEENFEPSAKFGSDYALPVSVGSILAAALGVGFGVLPGTRRKK
jgi:hypothetical protein